MPEIKIQTNHLHPNDNLGFQLKTLNHMDRSITTTGGLIEESLRKGTSVAAVFCSHESQEITTGQIKDLITDVFSRMGLIKVYQSGGNIVVVFNTPTP